MSYEKVCAGCGKTFITEREKAQKCDECLHKARRRADIARLERLREANRVTKICEFCGKEFNAHRSNQRTCSPECAQKLEMKKQREKRQAQREERKRGCPTCGRIFLEKAGKIYCCEKCKNLMYKSLDKGMTEEEVLEKFRGIREGARNAEEKQKREVPWPSSMLGLNLATVEALARQKGLSYGTFVAIYIAPEERRYREYLEAKRTEQQKRRQEEKRRREDLEADFEKLG